MLNEKGVASKKKKKKPTKRQTKFISQCVTYKGRQATLASQFSSLTAAQTVTELHVGFALN